MLKLPKAPSNPLFRLLLWNWFAGATAAVVLIGGLIASDAMHLRRLIFASEAPWVPLFMLGVGFLVMLCSVAMGTAIMTMSGDEPPAGGRRLRPEAPPSGAVLAPVAVVAERRRR
jgi:hypothetical protein